MSAGVPLSKIGRLRDLLEGNGLRLTNSTHLYDYIPLLLKQEKEKIHAEVARTFVSAIFDGITRFGEALAIIVCVLLEMKSLSGGLSGFCRWLSQ